MTFSLRPLTGAVELPPIGGSTGRGVSGAGRGVARRTSDISRFDSDQEEGGIVDLDDILLFAPRAAEGLVRGVVGLVDILPGVDTGIAERRSALGRSDTIVGGLLEGGLQTLAPYVPIFKGLGLLARGGKSLHSGRAAVAAGRRALGVTGRKIVNNKIVRGAAAGGAADFIAFSGVESRFSNLIESLAPNSLTAFLAASEDDPELLGRLKNVLEGAGLGAAFEGLFAVGKAVKAGIRSTQDEAGLAEVIVEQLKKAEEPAKKAARALTEAGEKAKKSALDNGADAVEAASKADLAKRLARKKKLAEFGKKRVAQRKSGATPQEVAFERTEAERRRQVNIQETEKLTPVMREHRARLAKADRAAAKRVEAANLFTLEQALTLGADVAPIIRARVPALADPQQLESAVALFDNMIENNSGAIYARLGGNPRKLPKEVKALIGMAENNVLSLGNLVGTDKDPIVLIRALEKYLENQGIKLRRPKQTEQQMVRDAAIHMSTLLDMSVDDTLARISGLVDNAQELGRMTMAMELATSSSANRTLGLLKLAHGGGDGLLAKKLKVEGLNEDALVNLARDEMRRTSGLVRGLSQVASETGRTLRGRRVSISPEISELADLRDWQKTLGVAETKRRLEMLEALGNFDRQTQKAALIKFREMTSGGKFTFFLNDWVITNILWAPKTLVTNLLFPAATSLYVPLENMLGGALTGNAQVVTREINGIMGMLTSIPEAVRFASRAFKEGSSTIDPRFPKRDDLPIGQLKPLSAEILGEVTNGRLGPDSALAGVVNAIGNLHSFPNRFMGASDEFVKVMTARGHAKAYLADQAMEKGLTGTSISDYVQENFGKLYDSGQLLTKEKLEKAANAKLALEVKEGQVTPESANSRHTEILKELREEMNFEELHPVSATLLARGREATATTPLKPGSVGHSVQQLINQHPLLRLIAPFVRTPVNTLLTAGQRTGVAETAWAIAEPLRRAARWASGAKKPDLADSALRNIRDLHAGGSKRSEAIGRLTAGAGVTSVITWQAHAGNITGAGPAHKEQRRQLLEAGWMPYSIRIPGEGGEPDKYIEYRRADPFAIHVGMVADLMEASTMAQIDEGVGDMEAVMVGIMTSLSKNLTERTYLAGVRGFMDAISDPQRSGPTWVAGLSGGILPRGINEYVRLSRDPVLRDTHGILNKLRSRLPMLGEAPPVRAIDGTPIRSSGLLGADPGSVAALWGDYILPWNTRQVGGKLEQELATHRVGYGGPPREKLGIPLHEFKNAKGQDAYDRWGELQGQVKIGGRTIKQALNRLIARESYQRLPLGTTASEETPRAPLVRSIIRQYRERAFQILRKEYPDFDSEYLVRKQDRRRTRAGLPTRQPLLGVPLPQGRFLPGGTDDPRFASPGDTI